MKFRHFLLLGLCSVMMFSCVSTKKRLDPWLGSTKKELIMSWGPPIRTVSDGGTGEILVYADQSYLPEANNVRRDIYWVYKYMYVNSDGKIYHWLNKASRIPPTEVSVIIK